MLVISPHLDDAVFACAEWIAAPPACTVATVFAGVPRDGQRRTEWDRRCGFADAADAVGMRRHEDKVALSMLGAKPLWLAFADSQYEEPATDEEIAAALVEVLRAHTGEPVLLPLGLFHADHVQAHRAARIALHGMPHDEAYLYEDAPYRRQPGLLQRRLAELHDDGLVLTPALRAIPPAAALKQQAVLAYASQRRALDATGLTDTTLPERCWRIEPVTPSSEPSERTPHAAS